MKKTITKIGILILISITAFLFNGCNKGDKGDQGIQGPAGPEATSFDFDLTFNTGDTYQTYSGITGYETSDIVVTYILYENIGSEGYWTQLPVIFDNTVNIIPEFGDQSGLLYINTVKANGTSGSPWTVSTTLAFKAVLIKGRALSSHPGIQNQSYEKVKETFHLK